ncbi:MAG: hypothetical protein V3U75_04120 [Methylococcaceae bacterium]
MTNAEKICREYWATCVKTRDKWCILCGSTNIEAHHIFLRSQGDWPAQYNIDFGVSLCTYPKYHHNELTADPYGELFEKIIIQIRQKSDEILFGDAQEFGRADAILKYHNSVKTPCVIPPDFRALKTMLGNLLKNLRDQAWTEADCVHGYGDAI